MSELFHVGVSIKDGAPGRGSGRYALGSGENPYQHQSSFLGEIRKLKEQGLSDTEIAKAMGMSTTEFRAKRTVEKERQKAADISMATRLKDKGYSNVKIGEIMGIGESQVRNLLNPVLQKRNDLTSNTADILEKNAKEKKYLDIGAGVEQELGVSDTRLKASVAILKEKGYNVYYIKEPQVNNPGKYTWVKVLTPPDVTYSELSKNRAEIKSVTDYSVDNGETFLGIKPPVSVNSDRIYIRYGDQGGSEMDGVIQLRPGVEDISLGDSHYAQVRVSVDDTHFLKGMAMYADDIPAGYDIVYNTNKKTGTPKEKVFKPLKGVEVTDAEGNVIGYDKTKVDKDNPFGATIKARGQRLYLDKNGKEQQSAINIVNEEGDWGKWSKTLSSQMLSKQPVTLVERQLNLSYSNKAAEFDEIKNLTNPAVKRKLLESFADDCDASAVHLKAAALPRQTSKVILPIPSLKDDEIYAPSYNNGETVVLIRHPHGGTFEIPTLKVNNKQKDAKKLLGNAEDAVGINSNVAERLSGADFDGDTVLVIPVNNRVRVKTSKPLDGLKDFNPKEAYPEYPGMKVISSERKQTEMGKVSNLITDMTLKGADPDEIAAAVRHSMVVIDAEKHHLDYQRSYDENHIAELKEKYQGGSNRGASTLISKSKSVEYIPQRKPFRYDSKHIDPETGYKLYEETGESYTSKKTGKVVVKKEESTKMERALTTGEHDAKTLSSGTLTEDLYADYANKLYSLGNEARKEYLATPSMNYNPSAKAAYSEEVKSLDAKLGNALRNAPRERQAQLVANSVVEMKKKDNPELKEDKAQLKKVGAQALSASRARLGASKEKIKFTDREWEAIQAGAISENKLTQMLNNADMDSVREKATPRSTPSLSSANKSRIRAMNNSGYTLKEIADVFGVSPSAISFVLSSKEES